MSAARVTKASLAKAARERGLAVSEEGGVVTIMNGPVGVVVRGERIRRYGLSPILAVDMTANDASRLLGLVA